jgi:hypothetical protein
MGINFKQVGLGLKTNIALEWESDHRCCCETSQQI